MKLSLLYTEPAISEGLKDLFIKHIPLIGNNYKKEAELRARREAARGAIKAAVQIAIKTLDKGQYSAKVKAKVKARLTGSISNQQLISYVMEVNGSKNLDVRDAMQKEALKLVTRRATRFVGHARDPDAPYEELGVDPKWAHREERGR